MRSIDYTDGRSQGDETAATGRREKKQYRQRVELTPPPELAEEERARIKEQAEYVGCEGEELS